MTDTSESAKTAETLSAPLDICIEIAPNLSEEAQKIAIAENPDNAVVVQSGPASKTRLALQTAKKWKPGRTLRVRFLDGEPIVHQKVAEIARQWSQYANIRFSFGNHPQAEIRISFKQEGTWSALGTDALLVPKDQPTMNYELLKSNTPEARYSRDVLHEFGHALGCIHEHVHPEAGISWNKEAVYRYYMAPPNSRTKEEIDRNLFKKYSRTITQFSRFDPKSIMIYPIPKKLTTNGYEVGWNGQLSATDKAFIAKAYPR
ncbi:hypothetical protein ACKFKG_14310 [Phormidesmis sp. 146-35]